MKISVTRSGGFAGLNRTWSVTVKDDDEAEKWRELIERLPWEHYRSIPEEPDRFVYRVRCARHEAIVPEQLFTGAWRELLDKVLEADDGGIP